MKANPGRIMGNIGSRAVDQKNINIRPTEILIDFDHCFLFVLFYFPFMFYLPAPLNLFIEES